MKSLAPEPTFSANTSPNEAVRQTVVGCDVRDMPTGYTRSFVITHETAPQ